MARTKRLQYDCSNWVQDQQCKQTKLRAINFQHFHGIHMEAKSEMENWGHLCTLFAFNRKPLNKLWSLIISVPFENPVDFRDVVAHRMPYFSVLGILKYGIGWRPQNAEFEMIV